MLGGKFEYVHVAENIRYLTQGGVGDFSLYSEEGPADLADPADRALATTAMPEASGEESQDAYIIYKRSGQAPGDNAHRMTLQQLQPDLLDAIPFDPDAGPVSKIPP